MDDRKFKQGRCFKTNRNDKEVFDLQPDGDVGIFGTLNEETVLGESTTHRTC